jgi:hypothetical protein
MLLNHLIYKNIDWNLRHTSWLEISSKESCSLMMHMLKDLINIVQLYLLLQKVARLIVSVFF